jgi:uncharacterized repeat protein (TIGR01451 family)
VASVAIAAGGALVGCQPPQPWSSELASVNGAGADAGDHYSDRGVISPDGTKVAFESEAGDLGPHDTNGFLDVYVRDLVTGTTELVSVNAGGTDAGRFQSVSPQFSPDGTAVAFLSFSDDLMPGGFTGWDIYLRDLTTDTTTLVSVDDQGGGLGGDVLDGPAFSPDGTRIAFTDARGVYIRDLVADTTTFVTPDPSGPDAANGPSYEPVFSPDGTELAFRSEARNLGPTDTNGEHDVYLADLTTAAITLVSTNAAGTDSGNGSSSSLAFSPDGSQIAFASHAPDLGPVDTNATVDVYLRDRTSGTTTLVSTNAAGTDSGNSYSGGIGRPEFDADGTGLAFSSHASNLGPTDTNGADDVYHRDLVTGTTSLISVDAAGTDSGAGTSLPVAPGSASFDDLVAFTSSAGDLGPRDTNRTGDLYVRDLASGVTTLVSTNAAGTDSGNAASGAGSDARAPFSADGRHVVFRSGASDLGGTDTNGLEDVYVATLHAADLTVTATAGPEPAPSGGDLTYRLHVANAGPDPADEASVALLLPEATAFVAATTEAGPCPAPEPDQPRVVVCPLGDLPAGGEAEVTIIATVTAPAGATLTAIAAVRSATIDHHPADNVATVDSTVD